MTREAVRIRQARTDVRFYCESLTAMLATTHDKRLIGLIESTLQAVNQVQADPLLYARHGRRRPDLLSRWLVTIEERLRLIDADYKILIHWLEHHNAGRAVRSAERGFVRLGPLVRILDRVCGDARRTFLSGLVLTASPVVAWSFLRPPAIFYLMLFGTLCSAGSLVGRGAGRFLCDA